MDISNFGTNENKWQIASLYKFVKLKNVSNKRNDLQNVCEKHNIFGTLILAEEGINGTITGERDSIDVVLDEIVKWPEVETIEVKYSESSMSNFRRLKIKQKKETINVSDKPPQAPVSTHTKPKDPPEIK